MSPERLRDSNEEDGSALLIVLFVALFLSVVLAGALGTARVETHIVRARLDQLAAREAAFGGLELALYRATVSDGSDVAGAEEHLEIGGYDVRVARTNDNEKIDVNLADQGAWTALLQAAGLAEPSAGKLAAHVVEARTVPIPGTLALESGDLTLLQRPFADISELQSIVGVTTDLYACISPALSLAGTGGARDLPILPSLLGLTNSGAAAPTAGGTNVATSGLAPASGRRSELVAEAVPLIPGKPKTQITGIAMLANSRDRPFVWIVLSRAPPEVRGLEKCGPPAPIIQSNRL